MILFAHMDSKDLYFIIFLYKKNGCRRSFCVDVYTTKGIRFHMGYMRGKYQLPAVQRFIAFVRNVQA